MSQAERAKVSAAEMIRDYIKLFDPERVPLSKIAWKKR